RDEGTYAYIAQRALQGEVPYQSAFDHKPPAIFLAYALIERWIGTSAAAIRWAAEIYSWGTLALVFFIGRRFFSETAGVLAAIFAAFMMADVTVLGHSANT